jgi:hypothetical protein
MKRKISFGVKTTMAALILWVGGQSAQAAMVVYEDVGFLSSQKANNNHVSNSDPEAFSITKGGSYQARLVDFVFPESFKKLELSIASGSPSALHEVARLTNPGELIFDAMPGTYWVSVFGEAGDVLGLGLYGVQIEQYAAPTPVPLPPALWLLGSAMASLVAFRRQRPVYDSAAV